MELTVLGASGTHPSPRSACSGYLLRDDGFAMWVDAGSGTMAALQRHARLEEIGAIYLSHVHADHCVDLFPYYYWLLFAQRDPVPVFAPPGTAERMEALLGEMSQQGFRSLLDWREIRPGDTAEAGPFAMRAFDARHSAPNNTLRVSSGGRTLCYSGDTGPNEHLAEAARDADVLLCESSWTDEMRGPEALHLTAGEAGEAARAAGCERLILTHVWPSLDHERVREQAAQRFGRDVELAVEVERTTV